MDFRTFKPLDVLERRQASPQGANTTFTETENMNDQNNLLPPWRPATERPETGRKVWIIEVHHKEIYPQSYQIHAGVVEQANDSDEWRVAQNDETGGGWCSWYPEGSIQAMTYESYMAWCYAEEFSFFKNPLIA